MDDAKDKIKGFMKKVNIPFSSSPFKGQGRVLGGSSSSPSPSPSPSPYKQNITSGKRSQSGPSMDVFHCPMCQQQFPSEDGVSDHIDICDGNKPIPETVESIDDGTLAAEPSSRSELVCSVTPPPPSPSNPQPTSSNPSPEQKSFDPSETLVSNHTPSNGFDPFDTLITSIKRSQSEPSSMDVFNCPSGIFKGQGRVLGSSSSSSSSSPSPSPYQQNIKPKRRTPPPPPKPTSSNPNSDKKSFDPSKTLVSNHTPSKGFDPFDALITSSRRSQSGPAIDVFNCPICQQRFRSEDKVSKHMDICVGKPRPETVESVDGTLAAEPSSKSELVCSVTAFVSGGAPEGSVEIVLKLLRNIINDPTNVKFRRIRMSNPKIREAIGVVAGGVELLECVGFRLQEEGEEMWAVMEVPSKEQIYSIKEVISLLDPEKKESLPSTLANGAVVPVEPKEIDVEPKKIDRQVKVFFSLSESIATKIELPESFYKLSMEEVKREADLRKKKMAESQLLIPKSFKERQAKAARKRYKRTVIRIQFPDEVVLQGFFLPWESTTALYEFVSSSLKEPCLKFELWHHPPVLKRRAIPRFSVAGKRTPTLEEEELVPSVLIKFRPIETDSIVFTGLRNELLEISEPLTSKTTVSPA